MQTILDVNQEAYKRDNDASRTWSQAGAAVRDPTNWSATMQLAPTEQGRLTVFLAAELARRSRRLGLLLNAPEAIAIACDEMHLAARAGATFDEVAAAGDDERRLGLDTAHMLTDQQRRLQPFAEPLVTFYGAAGVTIGVLVPEEPRIVARTAHLERDQPRAQFGSRIVHEREVIADRLAYGQERCDFALRLAVVPAVNLEAREAPRLALDGVVGERLG